MTTHAGPWKLYWMGAGGWRFNNGRWGFDVRALGCDKRAAHDIRTRLNAHDDMLAALRKIETRARAGVVNPHDDLGEIARAAIARVEGKS